MRIKTINIQNYRSINACELTDCGGFNVIIGKNNSGKSNILSAISAFFRGISGRDVVSLDTQIGIGREFDFYERRTNAPITIAIIFELTLAERDELIRDIVIEAPQVKNATDGLDPSLRLSVTYSIRASPNFGYVSRIALTDTNRPTASRVLFELSDEAANEIQARIAQSRSRREDIEQLRNLINDLRRAGPRTFERRDPDGERRPFTMSLLDFLSARYVGTRLNRELFRELESLVDEPLSSEDVTRAIQTLITRLQDDILNIESEPIRNKVGTFSGEENRTPKYVLNLLAKISNMKVLYLKERREPIGREEASKLLALKVTRGGPEVLRNIQETVSALLGVQIDAFQSDSPVQREQYAVRTEQTAEMDIDNFLADVNGSGIREALRIILDVEFEHPTVLLIEEPEIYLHPSLETSMMRYLKRVATDCQVFISTHSTNFLDTGEMKNVYLVSKAASTQVQRLDLDEAENYIPQELGIRLSSLFMFDRLVFVEGSSDEAVIREWASILKVNLSQQNVGFIHMGGVRNFAYFAAESTLGFLSKRRVKMWFIIDRDEKDGGEIHKLRELASNVASIKVLERRELENYLLSPRALAKFIRIKHELAGGALSDQLPSEAEIQEALKQAADKLKNIAVAKRLVKSLCKPLYPDLNTVLESSPEKEMLCRAIADEFGRLQADLQIGEQEIQKTYESQLAQLNQNWETKRLGLVPGDTLLDEVCKLYGVRFKKDIDSARIAALMTEDEIEHEIASVIREMGRP